MYAQSLQLQLLVVNEGGVKYVERFKITENGFISFF